MGDDNHQASNRELRERVKELERQLLRRDTDPGQLITIVGDAPLVEQLDAVLAFEPMTIYVLNRNGTLIHVTARTDKSNLVGQSAFDLAHPDSQDEFRLRFDQVLALGESVDFEFKAREDDIEAHWYRARLNPWRSDGSLVGAIAVCAIMDHERQARIENERFRAILEQANEAIFVVDPRSARYLDVNTRACELLGYSRSELLALGPKDVEIALPIHSRKQWTDHLIEIMASGPRVVHGTHQRRDGSTFPVESTLSIKPFEGDEYLLVVCRDMTEATRIRSELQRAEEAIRVNDRLTTVGTLAAGVAHEINNPLAYVLGNIEFATDQIEEIASSLPDHVRMELLEALSEARHGATRMSRIVRDLRTFSRRDDDSVGPVSINDVLESSINISMNEIRPRAQLKRDYAPDLIVIANEPRLGQVFLNLLINAAHTIPPGNSRTHVVGVRTFRRERHVVVEISDTGPGMAPDVAARIFEPFLAAKPTGTASGFGLSIAHNIIAATGGAISVDTAPGKGTTFRIELPMAQSDAERDQRRTAPGQDAGRILIIDDDQRTAKALRRILHVHDVDIEHDGDAAIQRAITGKFDVIFCDMNMPDAGGIAVFRAIHHAAPMIADRVVFVTDGNHAPPAREFLDTTANEAVTKPYDATHIRRLVTARIR